MPVPQWHTVSKNRVPKEWQTDIRTELREMRELLNTLMLQRLALSCQMERLFHEIEPTGALKHRACRHKKNNNKNKRNKAQEEVPQRPQQPVMKTDVTVVIKGRVLIQCCLEDVAMIFLIDTSRQYNYRETCCTPHGSQAARPALADP